MPRRDEPIPESLLDTPWGVQIGQLMRDQALRQSHASEVVTINWLLRGNVEPLAFFFEAGLRISKKTLMYFGQMIREVPQINVDVVPFKIGLHRRTGQRGAPAKRWKGSLIEYLNNGDLTLLSMLLENGTAPEPSVLKHLAKMLVPIGDTEHEVPYEFVVSNRHSGHTGARRNFLAESRDRVIADRFADRMAQLGPGTYEAVLEELVKELKPEVGRQTIRDAYDRYYAKK